MPVRAGIVWAHGYQENPPPKTHLNKIVEILMQFCFVLNLLKLCKMLTLGNKMLMGFYSDVSLMPTNNKAKTWLTAMEYLCHK